MAEGEAGQQVEGDGREAHAAGDAAEDPESEDDRSQFDEHGGRVVHGRMSLRGGSVAGGVRGLRRERRVRCVGAGAVVVRGGGGAGGPVAVRGGALPGGAGCFPSA